jgi:hypothetical protein
MGLSQGARLAGYKPAIQQIENLRYTFGLPELCGTSGPATSAIRSQFPARSLSHLRRKK